MLQFRLSAILQSPCRLSQETGLSAPTCYRLANPDQRFGRFTADTLDRLCAALGVQPGDLPEWVPEQHDRARPRAGKVRQRAA